MADRRSGDLTRIGRVIEESMAEGYLGLVRELVRVFEVWEAAVGPYNASKAVPESVKNGRLTVLVESSVWIDRFGYLKAEFIESLNRTLGAPLVKEIIFRVGSVPPADKAASRRGGPEGGAEKGPSPDTPAIRAAVAGVTDPELRNRLAELLARQGTPRKE